jgi:hypothetical protein
MIVVSVSAWFGLAWKRGRSLRVWALLVVAATGPATVLGEETKGPCGCDAEERFATNGELLTYIRKLEERISQLEARVAGTSGAATASGSDVALLPERASSAARADRPNRPEDLGRLSDAFTANFFLDGYYGYNLNRPLGRINLLRAYDVTSNNFTLSQGGVVLESLPDVENGRRYGGRLDLQFGQATETLQGGAQNEPRPQVYRNIFQAYGTYDFPVGSGLNVDFGKFASALGYEGNYAKDQINYSRSYWFNFLPFYHTGFRTTYEFTDTVSLTNWVANGANQTEDFNGFKSTAFLLNLKPAEGISWNLNYYVGREGRDLVPILNPGFPVLPTQPGLSVTPVDRAPDGRLQVFDTYVSAVVGKKLLLVGELDLVTGRTFRYEALARASGGAAYARYQFTSRFGLGGRFGYINDDGGLFSGTSQKLMDTTLTGTYRLADTVQARLEYRRDLSNRDFFLTDTLGRLKKEQNTLTLGLIWSFGAKSGAW